VTTLVDSSVLLDVLAPSDWRQWSEEHLSAAGHVQDVLGAQAGVGAIAQRGHQ
jgi:hypothetical protein